MSWKNNLPKKNIFFETENGILYKDDSLNILKNLKNESVDLILTDPPYGVGSNEKNGINYKDTFFNVKEYSKLLFKVLKNNNRLYMFMSQKRLFEVINVFEKYFILHQILIWFKPNLAGGTKKKVYEFTSVYENILNFHKGKPKKLKRIKEYANFDVLKYAQPQKNYKDKRYHIHQKPLKLLEHLLIISSDEEEIVLDPFAGSGTTCVVAEKLNRKWIGIEIEKEYCDIIVKRIKNL